MPILEYKDSAAKETIAATLKAETGDFRFSSFIYTIYDNMIMAVLEFVGDVILFVLKFLIAFVIFVNVLRFILFISAAS